MPAQAKKAKSSLYSVHPGAAMVQNWITELKGKTGRTLDEWIQLVKKSGPPTNKERREWLKKNHKLGTNSASWIADRAEGKGLEDGHPETYLKAAEAYVEAMFKGSKAGLRPIYERLLDLGLKLGDDAKACPCKTIVPLYREHVFAQIKPTTQTRIDLGFALAKFKGKLPKRLIDTGGLDKGDRITHRIPISRIDESMMRSNAGSRRLTTSTRERPLAGLFAARTGRGQPAQTKR